jgi:hypothetical protein
LSIHVSEEVPQTEYEGQLCEYQAVNRTLGIDTYLD